MGRFEHNKYAFVSIGKLCAGGMFLAPNIPLTLSQSLVTLPGMNQKHIFVVVGIFLLLGATGGVLVWRKKQSAPQPTVPMVQVDGGKQSDIPQSQADAYPQHIEAISGTDEVWYNIPEYGVRMRLNKEFAEDLIYSSGMTDDYGEKSDGIYLSTKNIATVAPECSPERGGAFGFMFKLKGDMKEMAKNDEYLEARVDRYVQIGEYFYGVSEPQAPCWNPDNDEAIEKATSGQYIGPGYKNITDGVKTIQLMSSK